MFSARRSLLLILAITLTVILPAQAAKTKGFIRVNQIGYEAGLSARAYLMTTEGVSAVNFSITNSSGTTVASGAIGATLGAWGSYSVWSS